MSCNNNDNIDMPAFYEVKFENQYFEKLNTLEMEGYYYENIDIEEELILQYMPPGKILIKIITNSGLELSAKVNLVGVKSKVRITLSDNGIINIK